MSENKTVDRRWFFVAVAAVVVVGLLLVGTNMPPIGVDIQSLYVSNFGGPEIPEIALNPPNEDDRNELKNYLMQEEGIPEGDFGEMRAEVGNYILPKGDEEYLFSVDNIPQEIPVSEWIVIENLEIIEGEWLEFELRNVGLQEAEIPFFILNTVIIVEDKKGNLHRLDARRLAWIEVSGNNILAPGEKKEIISENPFKILKEREERDGIICVEIESVWIEFQSAEDVQFLLGLR
jgi:hypothetical protein